MALDPRKKGDANNPGVVESSSYEFLNLKSSRTAPLSLERDSPLLEKKEANPNYPKRWRTIRLSFVSQ